MGRSITEINFNKKEETDVTEPVGGSLADYGACYELLDCMISSLVVVLNEEELLC